MPLHSNWTGPACALAIVPTGVRYPPPLAHAAPVLYEIIGESTEIGSAEDNAIVLSGPNVAPHHLAVRRAGGREYLLVDLAARRRCRDLIWTRSKPGDQYWCPRHGSLERLNANGRCPKCKRQRGSLWLLRPLHLGDSFDIGKAFRATLVSPTPASPKTESRQVFPPNELFEPKPATPFRVAIPEVESEIPVSALPTNDSNLWQWNPESVPFPVFLHHRVNRQVTQHARDNSQREVGGVLLGDVRQDSRGTLFVVITHTLKAEFANETRGHLTFTSKTWLKIHQAHEAQYPDKLIVGWYHTHPGWTIFLSDWDLFIHQNFFRQPWQIALVLDPSLDQAGFFVWKGNQVDQPNAPVEPFRLIELDNWVEHERPRVRIRLTDSVEPVET